MSMQNCTFGDLEFDLVASPTGSEWQRGVEYAEHALITQKPRLQWTGYKLIELTLTMYFHAQFCQPAAQLSKINTVMEAHEARMLVMGSGEVKGEYVITGISETVCHTDAQGRTISANATVTMLECKIEQGKSQGVAVVPTDATAAELPIQAVENPSVVISPTSALGAIKEAAQQGRKLADMAKRIINGGWSNPMEMLGLLGDLKEYIPFSDTVSELCGPLESVAEAVKETVSDIMGDPLMQDALELVEAVQDAARDPLLAEAMGLAQSINYNFNLPLLDDALGLVDKANQSLREPMLNEALRLAKSVDQTVNPPGVDEYVRQAEQHLAMLNGAIICRQLP